MYNPDEDYQVMLAKLRTICQNKNITQYALAKATGMSTSSLSCLMRGETKPYIYTVLTICDALNVTIADLLEKQTAEVVWLNIDMALYISPLYCNSMSI